MNKFKKWFTLVEMIIAATILWFVMTTIVSIYFKMIDIKTDVHARTNLVKSTNNLVEKINIMMKNYSIDYEEYFNRKIVWCDWISWDFWSWWNNWHCDIFTTYGNKNNIDWWSNEHILYNCTSTPDSDGNVSWELTEKPWTIYDCEWNISWVTGSSYVYEESSQDDLKNWFWCFQSLTAGFQSFWQYGLQFWDVKSNADGLLWCKWDDDDTDIWLWPDAIIDNGNIKELYLISKDGKKRTYFRKKLVWSWDFNKDWNYWQLTWEKLYKLQILKLRWFDIWKDHKADTFWPTFNDWQIDTWACDKKEWFICKWDSIDWWYNNYNLPVDENDWWTDLTQNDISIEKFNLTIYPEKNPDYAWITWDYQIAPYIKMELKTRFYPINYQRKVNPEELMDYSMDLQTTFSIKPY